MKKVFIVISILLSVGMTFYSCGGSSINCDKACNKLKECNSSTDLTSCKNDCGKMNDTLNDDVLSKLNDCANQACSDIASCDIQAFQNCTTDISGFVNKVCAQIHSCGGIVDVEACKTSFSALISVVSGLKCFNEDFLNSLSSCTSEVTCDLKAVADCVTEKTKFLSEN